MSSMEGNDLELVSEEPSSQTESFEASKSGGSEPCDMKDFCPGIRIEAKDFSGNWYPAKVADVDWNENEILVHFENWSTKFDEWIPMDSSRLRPIQKSAPSQKENTNANTSTSTSSNASTKFVKGEKVMAMWSTYQKYPATIQAVFPNDRYEVLFYDGFLKRLKGPKITKTDGSIEPLEIRNFSDIGTKEERRERKRKINVAELFHINKRSKKKGLIHSKSSEMKTYPVNKSRVRTSFLKKTLTKPLEPESTNNGQETPDDVNLPEQKPAVLSNIPHSTRALVDTIPAALEVKYLDGRTEMWSKQLYQRSEGRSAGKLDIVILNPQGRKFRSRNEIMKYCEENGIIYTHEAFDFSAKGRPKSKPVMQTVPVKEEPDIEDDEKPPAKKPRRKSHPEEVSPLPQDINHSPAVVQSPMDMAGPVDENKVFIGDVEVVIENGKFICPVKICGKHFRRENLLHMHMKHYHPEFSKYLDYTPSVTDLAYARTVGSLETMETPPPPQRKRESIVLERSDKTPTKAELARRSSTALSSSEAKENKKLTVKPAEVKTETKTPPVKSAPAVTPLSPVDADNSSEENQNTNKSIADSFEIFRNTSSQPNSNHVTNESEENPLDVTTKVTYEPEAEDPELLIPSTRVPKISRHQDKHRRQRSPRYQGAFMDHIRKKKYFDHHHHRSNYKIAKQQSISRSHLSMDDQSNSNTSSQTFSMARAQRAAQSQPQQQQPVQLQISQSQQLQLGLTNEISDGKTVVDKGNNTASGSETEMGTVRQNIGVISQETRQRYPQIRGCHVLLENRFPNRHSFKSANYYKKHKHRLQKSASRKFREKSSSRRNENRFHRNVNYINRNKKVNYGGAGERFVDTNGLAERNKSVLKDGRQAIRSKKRVRFENDGYYLTKSSSNDDEIVGTTVGHRENDFSGEEPSAQSSDVIEGKPLDHTEGTEDSKSPLTIENEKVEKLRRNEIINCVCGITEEDGLMIQCDLCLCWQHGYCTDIVRDSDVPDKYVCTICKNPYRARQSMKYLHDQDWLKEGVLPSLSFRTKREDIINQRRSVLKRSLDLSGSISLLAQVIHSLRVKVKIAEKKDHPKLWLWAKKWNEKKPSRLKEEAGNKEEKPNEKSGESIAGEKTEPNVLEEQQVPKAPEPEAPIDSSECRLHLLDHLLHYQTLIDARLSCIESQVAELEAMQEDAAVDETPEEYPRTKATVQMLLRDLNTMKKIASM